MAPPLSAALAGKAQILPNPTAEPAAAKTNPIFEFQLPRVSGAALFNGSSVM